MSLTIKRFHAFNIALSHWL